MTQRVLDELRIIADKIDREAGQCSRHGQMERLERLAQDIRDCADDIGDD
jgi:hypothetical protein